MTTDIDNVMNLFRNLGNKYSYKKICEYTYDEKQRYSKLLEKLKEVNSSNASTNEKGKALEEIATFVLNSGHIFEIYNNIRTSTNELDQLVKSNTQGKMLCHNGIIDERLKNFIGECKNYQGKVNVTYVGKVCSLLSTTQNKVCILFSYHGVTGEGWKDAAGLIRKFYLAKEKNSERFCIIDFNINDFENINNGGNFLQIVEDKIMALQNDTNYIKYISKHEASEKILELQEA